MFVGYGTTVSAGIPVSIAVWVLEISHEEAKEEILYVSATELNTHTHTHTRTHARTHARTRAHMRNTRYKAHKLQQKYILKMITSGGDYVPTHFER